MKTTAGEYLKKKGNEVITIPLDASLGNAVKKMNLNNIGAVLVTHENKIRGIVSERDILQKLEENDMSVLNLKIRDAMTPFEKVLAGTESHDLEYLMNIMTKYRVRHLPIVNRNGDLRGIMSIGDCVKALLADFDAENHFLKDYISGIY